MKKIGIILLLVLATSVAYSQETPYLQLTIRDNFLTQKIDFLEGPKVLSKLEIQQLMASVDSETQDLYRRSMNQGKLNSVFAIGGLATTVGTLVYVISPQQQSSTASNLIWPLVITNTAFGILSGVFKRNARNLAREAVDSYNFGRTDAPVYFEENRVDVPLFSKVIRF
jgi:hypothetical protein